MVVSIFVGIVCVVVDNVNVVVDVFCVLFGVVVVDCVEVVVFGAVVVVDDVVLLLMMLVLLLLWMLSSSSSSLAYAG